MHKNGLKIPLAPFSKGGISISFFKMGFGFEGIQRGFYIIRRIK